MTGQATSPLRHLYSKVCQLLQLPQPASAMGLMAPSVSFAGPPQAGAPQHKPAQLTPAVVRPAPVCLAAEDPELPAISETELRAISDAEVPALSEAEVIEMKKICASNGEVWRLRMIEAYEQAVASIQSMYTNPQALAQMESRLLQDLLAELGEYAEA